MTAAAVLFDLDGLLIDSEPVWYEVEAAVVERLGGSWSHAHQAALVGGTLDQSCRYMLELTGSAMPVETLMSELLAAMVDRFHVGLPVHEGAFDLIDAVRTCGVPVGLVSSSYRALVDAALDVLGRHRFAVVVAGDEVSRGKPDPEPYRTACERLGVSPSGVVVLEDAPNGVQSAEAAGCVVVGVPSVTALEPLPRRPVVEALRAIDPDWLLSLPEALPNRDLP